MSEQFCDVGRGITLCYESFGREGDPPLLLIMGLATQMIAWPDEFCHALSARGFYVVRFDNRDCGRSTHVRGRPPTPAQLLRRRIDPVHYTLDDMADDAAGLLRELGMAPAHVVGVSMGGMIAQMLATRHPDAVRSMVSIMSNTGERRKGQPALSVYRYLVGKPPTDREGYVRRTEAIYRVIGSQGLPQDLDHVREVAQRSFDRGHDLAASGRQLAAIMASGNRTAALRRITAPTLVIHGSKDRMVHRSGGEATAKAIPGAKLMIVEGMGHDLPRAAWPQLLEAIESHARAAEQATALSA